MMRIRFSFERKMPLAYISHLDMLRLFLRALSRSRLPLAYSQGYNPHPRFTLALPLPLGITAGEEYGEVFFADKIMPDQFINVLQPQLPEALVLTGSAAVDPEEPSLASLVSAASYCCTLKSSSSVTVKLELLQAALDRLMAKEEILALRKTKKNKTTYTNVRPYIIEVSVKNADQSKLLEFSLLLQTGSQGGVSPGYVIGQLEPEPGAGNLHAYDWQIRRERLYFKQNGSMQPLSERR